MTTEEFGPFVAEQRKKHNLTLAIAIAVAVIVCLCIHFFPVYHVLQVWSPSYFTTGEVSKLLYIGSKADLDTARLFVARANEAFSDLSTPEAELDEKYGLLSRYATNSERDGKSEKHSLRLWAADFDSADGYGYVWVYYSNSVYDDMGDEICGCRNVPALWMFEKDEFGNWQLIHIKEHP